MCRSQPVSVRKRTAMSAKFGGSTSSRSMQHWSWDKRKRTLPLSSAFWCFGIQIAFCPSIPANQAGQAGMATGQAAMTRLLPIASGLLLLAGFALLAAGVYVALPSSFGEMPRLAAGGAVALIVWRVVKGIGQMD